MKTQYDEIHDNLIAVAVAINNNYVGFESHMAQCKLEEARLWFAQSSIMQPVQCTPDAEHYQPELEFVDQETAVDTEVPAKEIGCGIESIYTMLQEPDSYTGIGDDSHILTVEELPSHPNRPVVVPSKEELIFMAKEFGKTHGPDNLISLLGRFNAGKISELYSQGDEVVLEFVSAISK